MERPPPTDEGRTEHRLVIAGVVEQDGELFDEFRVRFKLPPPRGETGLALAFDRPLRPGRDFVMRFTLEDELGEGRLFVDREFTVPGEPQPEAEFDHDFGAAEATITGEFFAPGQDPTNAGTGSPVPAGTATLRRLGLP